MSGGRVRCRPGFLCLCLGGAGRRGSLNPAAELACLEGGEGIFLQGVCSPEVVSAMVGAPPVETAKWWLVFPHPTSWDVLNTPHAICSQKALHPGLQTSPQLPSPLCCNRGLGSPLNTMPHGSLSARPSLLPPSLMKEEGWGPPRRPPTGLMPLRHP